jgi:hypothetical protein
MVNPEVLAAMESMFGYVLFGAIYWVPLLVFWLVSSRLLLAEFGAERLFWEETAPFQFASLLNTGFYVAISLYVWRMVDEPTRLLKLLKDNMNENITLAWGTKDADLQSSGQYLAVGMMVFGLLLLGQKIVHVLLFIKKPKNADADVSLLSLRWRYIRTRLGFVPGIVGYICAAAIVGGFCYAEDQLQIGKYSLEGMERTRLFDKSLRRIEEAEQRKKAPNPEEKQTQNASHYEQNPTFARSLHSMAGALVLTSIVIASLVGLATFGMRYYDPSQVISGPVVVVSQVGILIVQILGFTAFHIATPILLFLVVGGLLVLWNMQSLRKFRYRFPGLEKYYDDPSPLKDYPAPRPAGGTPNLLDDVEVLKTHLAMLPEGKKRVVLLAVSGGGIRAAVWIPVVIEGIRQELPEFDQHVRIIAGASGGMVGAALDVASRGLPNTGTPPEDAAIGLGLTSSMTATQSLLPVIQTMVTHDLFFNMLSPFGFIKRERGRELEEQWQLVAAKRFPQENPWDRSFEKLLASEKQAKIPSLVITPTTVEDTRRVIISNLDLGVIAASHGPRLGAGVARYSRSSLELFKLFPLAQKEMPLRTAARMNATFPIVSPNVSLPTDPPRRLMDAGLYDNYGVGFLASWMFKNRETLMREADGVLIVELRAFPIGEEDEEFEPESNGVLATLSGFFGIISNPLKALFRGRGNIMFHRNSSGMAGIAQTFSDDAVIQYRAWEKIARPTQDFFQSVAISLDEDAALNWYLSGVEKAAIASHWQQPKFRTTVADIRRWLGY